MSKFKPLNLEGLAKVLEAHYGNLHHKMQRSDDLYNRKFLMLDVALPEGVPIHQTSTASTIVDTLRDQIRTSEPRVEFSPAGGSQKAHKDKDLMELWGSHVMRELPKHAVVDWARQLTGDFLLRGAACVKFTIDSRRLLPPPEKMTKKQIKEWRELRAHVWPFVVRPVDALSVFPAPGSQYPPQYIVEKQIRYAGDMWADYPEWQDKKGDEPTREVTWYEYWSAPVVYEGKMVDPGWYVVEVEGQRVIEKPNPYGLVPYIFKFSGLGRANHDGNPETLAVGMLDAITAELEDEIRIKTAASAQWQFHVFPRLITTEDEAVARKKFMKGPAGIIRVTDMSQGPRWLEQPEPSASMMQFLAMVRENIFRRVPLSLFDRPAGVDAGVHQALLIGQALKIISPITVSLDSAATELLNGLAREVAALKLDMNVQGYADEREVTRMVSWEDFKHFSFGVKFDATDPVENDRRMLAGISLIRARGPGQLPIISDRTYREKFMPGIIESNDEEEEQILVEQAVNQFVATGGLIQPLIEEAQAAAQGEQAQAVGAKLKQEIPPPGARERIVEELAGMGGGALTEERETAQEGAKRA